MTEQHDTIEALLGDTVPTLSALASSGQYYLPASHVQLLEQLEHLSRYSHFVQVITGAAGIGKTTLLQQFYPAADDTSVHACSIQAFSGMSAQALLAEIGTQLNLDTSSSSPVDSQLRALIDHAELLKQISRQLLIVIDDAELLASDAIELLLNRLSTLPDDDIRPHIVLFATAAIRQQLTAPAVEEVVASSCHFVEIEPLSNEELIGLLEHSFGAVAARLNEQQRLSVLANSLGLPGRIPRAVEAVLNNTTAAASPLSSQHATSIGSEPTTSEQSPELPPQATPTRSSGKSSSKSLWWGLSATAVLALLAAATWQALPTLMELRQSSLSSSLATNSAPEAATSNSATANSDRIRLQLNIDTEPKSTQPAVSPSSNDSGFEQRLAQARAALDAEHSLSQPSTPAVEEDTQPASRQQLEPAPIKADPVTASLAQTTESLASPTDSSQPLVLKLPATPDLATAAASIETATVAQDIYGDGRTLLSWTPSEYSLQMLGAREEKNILEFIAAMPDRKNLRYFFTFYKDKPWYVVLYGRYPDRAAAMTARGELPEPLRSKRPWARSVKGIQNDIRKGAK